VKLQWEWQCDGVWAADGDRGVMFELVEFHDGTRLSLGKDEWSVAVVDTNKPDAARLKALAERINDALVEFHTEGGTP